MEVRDEVISSLGAQDFDTSGYQMSYLEDIGLYWGDPDPKMDSLVTTDRHYLFLPASNDIEMCSVVENLNLIDDEENK